MIERYTKLVFKSRGWSILSWIEKCYPQNKEGKNDMKVAIIFSALTILTSDLFVLFFDCTIGTFYSANITGDNDNYY